MFRLDLGPAFGREAKEHLEDRDDNALLHHGAAVEFADEVNV